MVMAVLAESYGLLVVAAASFRRGGYWLSMNMKAVLGFLPR
jgi:hypothetical protein